MLNMHRKADVPEMPKAWTSTSFTVKLTSYVALSSAATIISWLAVILVIFTCHAESGCHCHNGRLGAGERTPAPCQLARAVKTWGRHSTFLIFIVPDTKVTLWWLQFVCSISEKTYSLYTMYGSTHNLQRTTANTACHIACHIANGQTLRHGANGLLLEVLS